MIKLIRGYTETAEVGGEGGAYLYIDHGGRITAEAQLDSEESLEYHVRYLPLLEEVCGLLPLYCLLTTEVTSWALQLSLACEKGVMTLQQ